MEPSSGPPRPALQPLADGDPVLGASHLARFEFSDAGTKILMVEWMPEAKDAGTGETAAITATTTTTTTTITADADAGADADAAADANEARTTEQSQAGTQPSGGLPAVAEGEGVDTATPAAAATPVATTTNTATFDSTSTAGANAHDAGAAISGPESAAWQVSWPGKSTFLPARDMDVDGDEASSGTNTNNSSPRRRRIYFLLPVETPVPATVTITPPGRGDDPIRVEPLPAIFPESLVSSVTPGPRGVLHTIWAKKRLSELEREMDAEMRANAESVGLEMALAEKQWIESNFFAQPPSSASAAAPTSPPRSPLYGRMAEKLSGLRLATSPADLVPSANTFTGAAAGGFSQTLSPSGNDDFAVPSFASLAGGANAAAPISLNAALHGNPAAVATPPPNKPSADGDDDLFALPMSPRSPEMKKSPFSFL